MKIFSPTIIGTLEVDGNSTMTGSLEVTAGITGSLLGTASFADTASLAQNIVNGLSPTFDNITVTNTASFGFVQSVTGSAVYIGDSFVVVNADSPAVRYAGIAVFDSGSSPIASASLEWDSLNDTWITQEETGNTSVIITGPTGSRGSETYTTVNKLQKGLGFNYIGDSSITDDGINVVFTTPIAGTSISASSGFLGDLIGTASFATSASFATNALSASFAPSTPAFPFTGSAEITGSLAVTGSLRLINNANLEIGVIGQTANTGGGNPSQPSIMIGYANQANYNRTFIFGRNNIQTFQANGNDNLILGSSNNLAGNLTQNNVLLGNGHTFNTDGTFNIIAGGQTNQSSGSSMSHGALLGGNNNRLGHSRSAVIGGQNISTTADDTVFVPNLNVSGSSIFKNNVAVTGSVNIRNGAYNITTGSLSGSAVDNISNITGSTQVQHIAFATQAQYDAITPDANTLYFISGSGNVVEDLTVTDSLLVSGSSVFTGSIVGNVSALSIASNTASLDLNTGNFFTLQLVSGSNTFINPTNIKAGQTINLRVNTTGSATVSFPSSVKQVSGSLYIPTTTTGVDIVTFISFDTGSLFLSNVKNLV
jgi:hypothetical protein